MSEILLKNVYTNGRRTDILVRGNIIAKIADGIEAPGAEVIDCSRMAAIPGFINMHTHAAMTMTRSAKEDMKLHPWLQYIWKIEAHFDEEILYWGNKLACLEMIKTGTTCFNDMYWGVDIAARACDEMGIRGVHSYCMLDNGNMEKAEKERRALLRAFEKSKSFSSLNMFAVSVHAPYTVCEDNMRFAAMFAEQNNLLLHIHLSETEQEIKDAQREWGCSPVEYCESLGILSDRVIAAHSLWLSPHDIELMGAYGVTAVHNINSNLKIASGYKFPMEELMAAGANVTLGTDGCGSSNNLDMLEALKTAAIVQKAWRRNPEAIPLETLLKIGSENAAKALGLNAGKIEEGRLADIALIDMNNVWFTPNYDFEANLVYSANSSCIDTLICDGRIVMRGRKVEGEQEILDNANACAERLMSRIDS
ncbi:MAG: amidohydrolase [Bacteroidales bacterium]|nr:amidohydrolase [Bacteroidales bacterium]